MSLNWISETSLADVYAASRMIAAETERRVRQSLFLLVNTNVALKSSSQALKKSRKAIATSDKLIAGLWVMDQAGQNGTPGNHAGSADSVADPRPDPLPSKAA